MKAKPFYLIILYFSVLGMLLSGYLSYYALFQSEGCSLALITCGEQPVKFFGVSQCVYGFVFFLIVGVVSVIGIAKQSSKCLMNTEVILGIAGSLFAGGLSVYELWIREPAPVTMPSCVYGFFLFLGAFLTALIAKAFVRESISSTQSTETPKAQ